MNYINSMHARLLIIERRHLNPGNYCTTQNKRNVEDPQFK